MGFLSLLFVPEAVCMLKLNSNHFWHASSPYNLSSTLCFLTVNFSLIYMYLFLCLQKNHMCTWRVLGTSHGHVQPSNAVTPPAPTRCGGNLGLLPPVPFWSVLLCCGAFLGAYWPTYGFSGPACMCARSTGSHGEVLCCLLLVSSPSALEEPIHTTWWSGCCLEQCSSFPPNKSSSSPKKTLLKDHGWVILLSNNSNIL